MCFTFHKPGYTAEETRQLSQIRPYLFMGGFDAASDWQNLKAQGITHVMNVAGSRIREMHRNGKQVVCYYPDKFTYKTIERFDDNNSTDPSSAFNEARDFIQSARSMGGRVLIHCRYGVSRSAACACSYLIAAEGLTLDMALAQIKEVRRPAKPNNGFIRALKKLEAETMRGGPVAQKQGGSSALSTIIQQTSKGAGPAVPCL